jgi:hypothetical protein
VILPRDMLSGTANELTPIITEEILSVDDSEKVYSMANALDLRIEGVRSVLGPEYEGRAPFDFSYVMSFLTEKQHNDLHTDGTDFVKGL